MSAETYLIYVAPVALLGLAFVAYAVSEGFGGRDQRKLQPIRIRKDDRRR